MTKLKKKIFSIKTILFFGSLCCILYAVTSLAAERFTRVVSFSQSFGIIFALFGCCFLFGPFFRTLFFSSTEVSQDTSTETLSQLRDTTNDES